MTAAAAASLAVAAALIAAAVAQPLSVCPCAQGEGYRQHWFAHPAAGTGVRAGAVTLHWGVSQGLSCLANTHTDNCSLCRDVQPAATAWLLNQTTGQLVPALATATAGEADAGTCLTALPPAPGLQGGRLGLQPCSGPGNENQSWALTASHELALKGGAVCVTGGNVNCTAAPPPPPPSPPPPSPPHPWPPWKPRRLTNAIVTRNSWPRYLAALKGNPGAINAVSEYMYEIAYTIPANWSLANRTPYALNFSREVQALSPKVRVTPVIAMGGSYATANFHAAEDFTRAMMAEAERWGWDGYTMETEIKYTEHAAIDMARFLDTFAGALHKVNKTLAVITKSTFRGHGLIGESAVDFIIPTEYEATGIIPGYIHDQANKYWRTCGATIDKFSPGLATAVADAMCTTGCHMLAMWADFDGLGEPWYVALRKWLNGTTSKGEPCAM